MNKKQARKRALYEAAAQVRVLLSMVPLTPEGEPLPLDDQRRVKAEYRRIADHLEWEADGRPNGEHTGCDGMAYCPEHNPRGVGSPNPCCDGIGYCKTHNPGGAL